MKEMNTLYNQFYDQNRWLIRSHILLTLLIVPMEIILFGIFSKKMFEATQSKEQKKIFYALLVFFIIVLVVQLLYLGKDMMDNRIIPEFECHVRSSLLKNLLQEPRNETDINMTESFFHLNRLSSTLHHNYENFLKYVIPFVAGSVVFTSYVFYISWQMGIFCLVFFLIFYLAFYYWFFHILAISNERFEKENDLMDKYENVILNQQSVHVAGKCDTETEECFQQSHKFQDFKRHEIHQMNWFRIVFITILFVFFVSLFIYSSYLHKRSPEFFPIWKLLAFLTILILMSKTMIGLLSNLNKIIYHYGNSSQLEKYVEKFPFPPLHQKDHVHDLSHFDIQINDLTYHYPNSDRSVFDNYHLTIPQNTSWLIKGDIGCGKSTLAQLIARLLSPDNGVITIGGVPIQKLSNQQFSRIVAYMNQKNILMNGKVIDNIFYHCPDDPYPVEELFQLDLPIDFMKRLYHPISRQGSNFSGGQRRLMFFLRSYFSRCKILIFDEPTANLDPKTRNLVIRLLQSLIQKKNCTVIVISHEDFDFFSNFIHLHAKND